MPDGGQIPTERQIQRAILKLVRAAFPRVFIAHIPNGAHLAGNQVARFKQMGALKGDGLVNGMPDLLCLWKGGMAMLEVKRPKGAKVSDEQKAIHSLLSDMGWPCAVVRSIDEARDFLIQCGAPQA